MQNQSPSTVNRVGIHYFPDTFHYRMEDLEVWLPEMLQIGASWTILLAPVERAVPELFIKGLLSSNVEPILHFLLPTNQLPDKESFKLLLNNYARWGIRYITFFDRPNLQMSWYSPSWAQIDLVERFLDHFLPLAELAIHEGLKPVFPPLEPGGDYWDLSFLRSALSSIQRRCGDRLIDNLALGAYAFTGQYPINWGSGGPERWLKVRPYFTPPEEQDHLGFRIFDWYLAISEQELERQLPIILLRAGRLPEINAEESNPILDNIKHAQINLAIARLVNGEIEMSTEEELVPDQLIACNFWVLATQENSSEASQAWFQTGNNQLPVVEAFHQWVNYRSKQLAKNEVDSIPSEESEETLEQPDLEVEESQEDNVVFSGIDPKPGEEGVCLEGSSKGVEKILEQKLTEVIENDTPDSLDSNEHPISHYVLLPLYAWGAANWDLALIQPILEESHPTVGFSLEEARMASLVTIVGGEGAISSEALSMLRASGCHVQRLQEDGILIAT